MDGHYIIKEKLKYYLSLQLENRRIYYVYKRICYD